MTRINDTSDILTATAITATTTYVSDADVDRSTNLTEQMGSRGAAERAGSGEAGAGDAAGDLASLLDDPDDDILELAEWLDEEDDDDFERDEIE